MVNGKGDKTELIPVLALSLATAMLILTSNSLFSLVLGVVFAGKQPIEIRGHRARHTLFLLRLALYAVKGRRSMLFSFLPRSSHN